eukprot:TRINITY_DN3579_c0_g3_i1.p1 TRINITY_DN3579_c0_g3~~TRINITY_DN3579_c0_g3_i1.p1  ORF type:complete len:204 (-),score=11.37 TRINITY_DN3579_c0_g3_i1:173-784(-)
MTVAQVTPPAAIEYDGGEGGRGGIEEKYAQHDPEGQAEQEPFEGCCCCTSERWTEWSPVCYKCSFGPSLTRGCFFFWVLVHLPTVWFAVARSHVGHVFGHKSCWTCIPRCIMTCVLGIIFVVWTVIGIILWIVMLIISLLFDGILILIYGITCCYCSNPCTPDGTKLWRTFTCGGWMQPEWQSGEDGDPYTEYIYEEWSPIHF